MLGIRAALFVLLLFAPSLQAQSNEPKWQKVAGGELILRPFKNAPFPHPSKDYTDATVAILIPAHYQQAELVNYVVHFHGHKNNVPNVLKQYKLPEQLVESKLNAILIVPQGPSDADDSSGGKLEEPGGFGRLISEITRYLRRERKITATAVGNIVLSAHSGGYKVAGRILYHGGHGREISDVLLLDATYGELTTFANFCRLNRQARLVSLYTDHLADENGQLMKLLSAMDVPYRELEEKTLKDADFEPRGAVFVHTSAPHDLVPVEYLARLLGTSAFASKPKTRG